MQVAAERETHSAWLGERVRLFTVEDATTTYEAAFYPTAGPGRQWGTIYNLTTHRRISVDGQRGHRIIRACADHMAAATEGVGA